MRQGIPKPACYMQNISSRSLGAIHIARNLPSDVLHSSQTDSNASHSNRSGSLFCRPAAASTHSTGKPTPTTIPAVAVEAKVVVVATPTSRITTEPILPHL